MRPRVPLDLGRVRAPRRLRIETVRAPGADPLTGHRGSGEGTVLVATADDMRVIAQLGRDERGLVLRGQVCAPGGAPAIRGGLVHVRSSEAPPVLAALGAEGAFVAHGLAGRIVSLDIEIHDGAHRLTWPAPAEAER